MATQTGTDSPYCRNTKIGSNDLIAVWLTNQIYAVVNNKKLANEAMQTTEGKIKFKKRKK